MAGPQVQATFRVYGDAGFAYDSRPPAGIVKGSFLIGALDFFASAQIEDHVRVLAETGVEYEPATNEAGIDLERLYGSYTLDDRLYFKIGREHSAVSRWDRRYHHGKLFWPSLTKPFLARFEDEGGPLPIHQVGLEMGGRAESKIGGFDYTVFLSNGRGVGRTEVTAARDRNSGKAVQGSLGFTPARFPNLAFGADLYGDNIPPDPTDPARTESIGERIGQSYVEFRGPRLETIAEGAVIAHDDRTSQQTFTSRSAYLHVGWHMGSFAPYGRIDWRRMALGDPFYAPDDLDLDRRDQVVGLRYDIGELAAVKVEAGLGRSEVRDPVSGVVSHRSVTSAAVQLAWGF